MPDPDFNRRLVPPAALAIHLSIGTGVVAACCWGGGFMISALGVQLHQIRLLWIGSGVIGVLGGKPHRQASWRSATS